MEKETKRMVGGVVDRNEAKYYGWPNLGIGIVTIHMDGGLKQKSYSFNAALGRLVLQVAIGLSPRR